MDQLLTDPEQAATSSAAPSSMRWRSRSAPATAPPQVHAQAHRRHPGHQPDREINKRIPNTHLVMHGSSSAAGPTGRDPQSGRRDEGDLRRPGERIQEAIKFGVRKINIDTDIRLAMTAAIRPLPGGEPGEVRSARLPEARARAAKAHLPAALSLEVRLLRPGGPRSRPSRWRASRSATPAASSCADGGPDRTAAGAMGTGRGLRPAEAPRSPRCRFAGARRVGQTRRRRRPPADGGDRPPERLRRRDGRTIPVGARS